MIDNISWLAIYPEIVLLTMACVIALVDLGVHSARRTATYVLTLLTLAVVAGLQAMYASSGNTFYGFGNMVVSDAMGNWLKCFATVAMMITLVYARPYAADRGMMRGGEMFTLSMFALLGMFIIPFAGLLGVAPKKNRFTLAFFCSISLAALWLERYLLVAPSVSPLPGPSFGVADIAPTFLLAGLFLVCYAFFARIFPMVSPRLAEITINRELGHHAVEVFDHEDAEKDYMHDEDVEHLK